MLFRRLAFFLCLFTAFAQNRIPQRLREFVDQGKASGFVTLVAKNGRVLSLDAIGYTDLETRQPIQTNAIFQLHSMTKPVVCMAAMMLAEQNKLHIDDPVELHLPEFRGTQWAIELQTATGGMTLQKVARKVTIRDLMTHTSGMILNPPPAIGELHGALHKSLADVVLVESQQPLLFQPGTKWSYSNAGIAAVARIVEVVSGMPYEKFLETRIFKPLGMLDTHTFPPKEKWHRMPTAYIQKDGMPIKYTADPLGEGKMKFREGAKYPLPEGGLYSTANDLFRLYQLFLNGGEYNGVRLLSKSSVDQMTTVHTGNLTTSQPGAGWGLGWFVMQPDSKQLMPPGTFGHGGRYGTFCFIDRQHNLIGIFLTHREGGSAERIAFTEEVLAAHGALPKFHVVDPGHFHAALLQKERYSGISETVGVYARPGPELDDYLKRVHLLNNGWNYDVHRSDSPMQAMLAAAKPGDIAVFTGRNRGKIDRILAALNAGLHVLADKPWIIEPEDMPKLEQALKFAASRQLAAYDIMTERYEVTSDLMRKLVRTPAVFGTLTTGTRQDPSIRAKSIHHVSKVVAGVPLQRPTWFFDVKEYGEGLTDVGTHVVDLMQWTAFPDKVLDYRRDVRMLAGRHWALELTPQQYERVTGAQREGVLQYICNNSIDYMLGGVYAEMEILWNWEAAQGGDVYEASFRGTRSRIEIRQGAAENYTPELYVVAPNAKLLLPAVKQALQLEASLTAPNEIRVEIPQKLRVGHEAHFAQVSRRFLELVKAPQTLPVWENPGMLVKYWISTQGVQLARKEPSKR